MSTRLALTLLVAVSLAVGLAACGGDGSSGSTSSSSAGRSTSAPNKSLAPTAAGSAPTMGSTSPGASPAPSSSGSSGNSSPAGGEADVGGSPSHRSSGGSRGAGGSGPAAAFLVAQGDNSIPTYGSEAPSSERAAGTTSLGAYLDARASGDWGTACSYMAAPVKKQLEALVSESNACPSAYAKLSSRVPASARTSPLTSGIAAFRVQGDKAFALFYGPHEQQYMMPMVSEGGTWKVNQIESIPWQRGS